MKQYKKARSSRQIATQQRFARTAQQVAHIFADPKQFQRWFDAWMIALQTEAMQHQSFFAYVFRCLYQLNRPTKQQDLAHTRLSRTRATKSRV